MTPPPIASSLRDFHAAPIASDAVHSVRRILRHTLHVHHSTVTPIQRHVNQQPQPNQPRWLWQREQRINRNSRCGMQRMKPDATTVGIIDRRGQQMIEIHHHRCNHDQPCTSPLRAKEQPGDDCGHREVQQQMKDGTERGHCDLRIQGNFDGQEPARRGGRAPVSRLRRLDVLWS